jgi:hypothetical protein
MGMGFYRNLTSGQSTETDPHPNPPLEREGTKGAYVDSFTKKISIKVFF